MGEYNDDYYYQKYLKYKNKYLELKQYEGGGYIPETGVYIYFCNNKYVDSICKAANEKTLTSYNINNILSKGISFKGKQGSSQLTQITQSRIESIKKSTKTGASYLGRMAETAARESAKGAAKGAAFLGTTAETAAKATASAVTLRTNQAATATRNTASAINKRFDNTNKSNFVLPSARGGAPINKINLTDANNKPIKLNITNMSDLKSLVNYLRSYSKDIDSIVIITFSPMGKNICNRKITFTEKELANVDRKNKQGMVKGVVEEGVEGGVEAGAEAGGVEGGVEGEQIVRLSRIGGVPGEIVLPDALSESPTPPPTNLLD